MNHSPSNQSTPKVTRQTLLQVAAVSLCLVLLFQSASDLRIISALMAQKDEEHGVLVRHSHLIISGRKYPYKYSAKLFAEQEHTGVIGRPVANARLAGAADPLPNVVYGVSSFAPDTETRDSIRRTWGTLGSQVFFLIANPPNDKNGIVSKRIMEEFDKHGDLIWLDIPESYKFALAPKTFAFQHFANHHYLTRLEDGSRVTLDPKGQIARKVDYIFKTDDDVFVNTTYLAGALQLSGNPDYYGIIFRNEAVIREDSDVPSSWLKWAMTKEDYPGDTYPNYAQGCGYAISTKSAFFHDEKPMATATTPMSYDLLRNYPSAGSLPAMVSEQELASVTVNPSALFSCTEQVMARMLFMPWEDVGTGLLSEACNVTATDLVDHWPAWREPDWHEDGSEVKIVHGYKPYLFEALMSTGASLKTAQKNYKREKKRLEMERLKLSKHE